MEKYKWKFRILLITTPSRKHNDYIELKEIYKNNKKKFHKYCIKILTKKNKEKKFSINLIGFDGNIKKKYTKFNLEKMIKKIKKMRLGNKPCPVSQSLYEDYNPSTTIHGLGFKDKKTALYTIKRIKNEPLLYQVRVVSTMLGREKNHPQKTEDMKKAILIYKKWLKKYNEKKK